MFETITTFVNKWNASKTERQKLQDVFLVAGCAIVLLSGLITFINFELGHTLVLIGLTLLGVFVFNAVVWHLLSAFVFSRLSTRSKKK